MEGSLYRRKDAKGRPSGPWILRYDLPPGPDGKRKQMTERCPKGYTKEQAEKYKRQRLTEIDQGTYVEPTTMTVVDLLDRWFDEDAVINTTPKTHERYRGIIRNYIVPALGNTKLMTLRPNAIQALYASMLTNPKQNGQGSLSLSSVRQCHAILHKALKWGVRLGLLSTNPADSVTAPRQVAPEIVSPTTEQVIKLLEVAKPTAHYIRIMLGVFTGMRLGEVLGLKWQDISFDDKSIQVNRSLQHTKEKGLFLKDPKTRAGKRTIAAPIILLDALTEHRREQQAHKEKLGKDYEENDLVCPRRDGKPISPDHCSTSIKRVFVNAGIGHFHFHDLRHYHATQLAEEGINYKVIQERLGHANPSITMGMYTHTTPRMQREAAEKMDRVLYVLNQSTENVSPSPEHILTLTGEDTAP